MMAVSTAIPLPGMVYKNGNPNLDLGRIDDDSRPGNTVYAQFARDQLEAAIKDHKVTSFTDMLCKLVNSLDGSPKSSQRDTDAEKFVAVLHSLSTCLDKLEQSLLVPIVTELLRFQNWSRVSPRITGSYAQFFSVLVSSSPKWWSEVARKVVQEFVRPLPELEAQHAVLKRIISIVPTSSAGLPEVFTSNFPHQTSSTSDIVNYTENLLEVLEYAPEQLASIWQLIIQKLVALDVECESPEEVIQRRFQEDEEDSDFDSDFESDDADEDEDADEDDGDEASENEASDETLKRAREEDTREEEDTIDAKRQKIEEYADGDEVTNVELEMAAEEGEPIAVKVDAVLSLLLRYLSEKFTPDAVKSGEATPLFKVLLSVFKAVVLPTADVQAVQFIWFHITQCHADLLASFVSVLLETALSADTSFEQRVRAMQYVASFVARARAMSKPQIEFVVSFLGNWVQRYIKERAHEVDESLSMARFRMFYAAVQALFYIFVFRHSMLHSQDEESGSKWVAGLDKLFPQAVNSKFNPLQYCQPQVVAMFARVAQHEEVASCHSIIERNRWTSLRTTGAGSERTGAHNGLFDNNRDCKLYDSFFPFQPLRLKNSREFFANSFEKWSEVDLSDSDTDPELEMAYSSDSDF